MFDIDIIDSFILFNNFSNSQYFSIFYHLICFYMTSLFLLHSNAFLQFTIVSFFIHSCCINSSGLFPLSFSALDILFSMLLNLRLATKTALLSFLFFFIIALRCFSPILLLIENTKLRLAFVNPISAPKQQQMKQQKHYCLLLIKGNKVYQNNQTLQCIYRLFNSLFLFWEFQP